MKWREKRKINNMKELKNCSPKINKLSTSVALIKNRVRN